jgi:hypothetical protein
MSVNAIKTPIIEIKNDSNSKMAGNHTFNRSICFVGVDEGPTVVDTYTVSNKTHQNFTANSL